MITADNAISWARELPFMHLRETGLTWAEIGDATGTSAQQAKQAAGLNG